MHVCVPPDIETPGRKVPFDLRFLSHVSVCRGMYNPYDQKPEILKCYRQITD